MTLVSVRAVRAQWLTGDPKLAMKVFAFSALFVALACCTDDTCHQSGDSACEPVEDEVVMLQKTVDTGARKMTRGERAAVDASVTQGNNPSGCNDDSHCKQHYGGVWKYCHAKNAPNGVGKCEECVSVYNYSKFVC